MHAGYKTASLLAAWSPETYTAGPSAAHKAPPSSPLLTYPPLPFLFHILSIGSQSPRTEFPRIMGKSGPWRSHSPVREATDKDKTYKQQISLVSSLLQGHGVQANHFSVLDIGEILVGHGHTLSLTLWDPFILKFVTILHLSKYCLVGYLSNYCVNLYIIKLYVCS